MYSAMKFTLAFAALAVVTQMTSGLPAVGGGAPQLPQNGSCLTPQQKSELETAVKSIHDVLSTASYSLTIAAALEKNATIKADLETAIQVVNAVNTDIVANLTKIANEACGTCSQILQAVDDAIDAIKQTLIKIDPDWQNNPIWKAVFTAITAIEAIVKDVCPSAILTGVGTPTLVL